MLNCLWTLCFIAIGAIGAIGDLQTPKNSGIIVNPFYDPKDDASDIKKSDLNEMLPPTHQQLAETLNLRNIINNAVRSNTYAVGSSDTSSMTSPKQPKPFSWFTNWLASQSNKDVASGNGDDDELGSEKVIDGASLGTAVPAMNNAAGEIQSNVIDSAIISRLESKPFTLSQKKVQREQLELISIEEELTFPHGQNVRSWITIETKANNQNGLVGIGNSTLVLVADRNGTYEFVEEMDLKTGIQCFTNYHFWNQTSKSVHGIVIVEIANQLLFISTRDDLRGLAIVWQWTIHSMLDSLFYFKHETSDMMLMVNAPTAEDTTISSDIYRFDLQSRHTWLVQKISLKDPCKSVAVINTYRELILSFAQNNTVELYKSDQYANSQSFKYFSSIEANSVQTVTGFQMGGFSYLGTTGLEPKIFRYHRGSFVAQTILSRRWGLVEFIFPIPARTYRDDLILLIQHRIMMGTHTVTVVEALIWDGESFDVSLSVPCRIGNEIMDFGMTCLLDYERDAGIDGLSIIQNGNSIALIVPRVDAPSSMFRLQFRLTSFESPTSTVVKDFEIFSKYIEATTNYQNEIMSIGTDALTRGLNANRNDVTAVWNLTTLTASGLTVKDGASWKIDEIYFGNEQWTESDLNANVAEMWRILQQFKDEVDRLEKEFTERNILVESQPDEFDMNLIKGERRTKRSEGTERHMNFNQLNVKHIQVDYINEIPVDDLVFISNGILNSVDSLIVENQLNVLNEVKVASERTETVGDSIEERHALNDNLHVTGDLAIDSINGVVWQDFIHQIVMRNLPNLIHKMVVNGDVVAKENIEVDFLNQISFPRDFLWMHVADINIITGHKVFTGIVTADSVDTSGTVDGIYTQETISLVEPQHIGGLTTFAQLEVAENLDINGTINGKHLDDFKPNLSLLQSNVITSDCLFQHLEVQGPIFITNNCNGIILDDILSDVVYRTSPKSTIPSFKTFETVDSVVELTSNLINNIPVNNYMTADTPQDITFDQFIGNVVIRELYTDGLFDFINVTEVDRNSIKLAGEQFTEAELIFEGGNDEIIDVNADTIEIQRAFNGLTLSDLIRIDETLEIDGNVVVNTAMINDLVISGEVNGNGIVNGISLSEFDAIRFSRERAQDITSMYHIENVVIDNDIDATYVNGVDIIDLRKHMNDVTNLAEFLSSGDVKVNNLVIDGNLVVQTINGHDFNSIRDNAVWLNQPNIVIGELQFLDGIEIGQGVIVNNVNNEIFENFVNGLVLKTDENVEFVARKIFQSEFHADEGIQIDTLNGISTKNIWTKSSSTSTIASTINVIGDLFVENVNVQGYLNTIYWRDIEDKYRFDVELGAHVLSNNIRFTSPTNINHLHIEHGLNSLENISDFLANVIQKSHNGFVGGRKQFQGNVIFMNHLQAAKVDAVDVPALFENVVFNDVNQKISIVGDVAFDDDVTASRIHVSGIIFTSTVMDCRLAEWHEHALSTNAAVSIFQPLVFPAGSLRTTNLLLQFLNGNPMATIFTLNSDQHFGHTLLSDLVSLSNINVDGLVNGYNVKALFENSVLVTGDNVITAPTTLQSARVLSVLQTVDTVNGKNLNNIATLYEDLYLHGPLSLQRIKARNLNTKDTISGIDFDYWYANSLWKGQRDNQIVRGVWTVTEGIFHASVKGDGTLNGIPIASLAGQINTHQPNVLSNFEIFNQGYVDNCRKMQNLIQRTQTLPYFLTHFEESFSLRVQSVLNSVHFFEAYGRNYVVINLGCQTVVYAWNKLSENYEKIVEIETGNVDSWLDMTDESKLLHLISNTETDRSNCPTSGLNIWKFDGNSLAHLSKITDANKFSLLHRSQLHPQRFLAMAKDAGIVNAFDLKNNLVEQWHLPVSNDQFSKFRFVPENANLGIALSNGKQLSSLSYTKSMHSSDNRKERSTRPLDDNRMESKRYPRCPILEEKLENATFNCQLWRESILKAISNTGPVKEIDPMIQSRLMNDIYMHNTQRNKPPFKLKAIPFDFFRKDKLAEVPVQNQQSPIVASSSDAEPQPPTSRNDQVNSTARDAFGDIEHAVIEATDNIIDSWMEAEADEEDVDFDDSLVGTSINDENKNKTNPTLNSTITNTAQTNDTNQLSSAASSARDLFGDIEAKTIKFADKVMDGLENFKDMAKESESKLHNLFKVKPPASPPHHPMNNGHYRKMNDGNAGEQVPKIPKVTYATNVSNSHVTQSPTLKYGDIDSATNASTVHSEDFTTSDPPTSSKDVVGEEEPPISKEISSEGIATAENLNFPNHQAEEIVAISVDNKRKHLIAVSSLREHTVQGKHDLIRIYEDIIEGNLFQTLVAHQPRSLTVLNIRDETILAFIENDAEIQIFVYRGIQGFVKFTSFELPSFVLELTSIHLPMAEPFECSKSFLVATMKKEIRFIEAKMCGYCGVNAQLRCE